MPLVRLALRFRGGLTCPGNALHPPRTMPTLMIPMSRIGAGSALLLASSTIVPRPSTAAPSGLQSSHSSTHSPALSPPGCSLFALSAQSSPSTQLSSGSCFSVACGSLCHLLLHDAAVGVRLMLWVATSLPARPGVLRARGGPLERAAARVCREAGAAVATHVLVRDLNLQAHRHDECRIEVIANGLPLWGGSQLAVDTTLVSPLTSAGVPRRRRGSTAAAALAPVGAAWLCSVLKSVVAGVPKLPPSSALLARARARSAAVTQRAACVAAFVTRWSGLLGSSCSCTGTALVLALKKKNCRPCGASSQGSACSGSSAVARIRANHTADSLSVGGRDTSNASAVETLSDTLSADAASLDVLHTLTQNRACGKTIPYKLEVLNSRRQARLCKL